MKSHIEPTEAEAYTTVDCILLLLIGFNCKPMPAGAMAAWNCMETLAGQHSESLTCSLHQFPVIAAHKYQSFNLMNHKTIK